MKAQTMTKNAKGAANKAIVAKAVAKAIKDSPAGAAERVIAAKTKTTKAVVKTKAAAKAPKAEPKNQTLDGQPRVSTVDSPCWTVWNLADTMKGAKRGEVIAAAVKAGVAYYTARTQYQHWFSAGVNGAKGTVKKTGK